MNAKTPHWLVSVEGPARAPTWATTSGEGDPVPYLATPSSGAMRAVKPPPPAPPTAPPTGGGSGSASAPTPPPTGGGSGSAYAPTPAPSLTPIVKPLTPGAAPTPTPVAATTPTPTPPPTTAPTPTPAPAPATTSARDRDALHRVGIALANIEELRDELVQQARKDAIELALLIAREVIGAELRHGHAVAVAVARDALSSIGAARSVTVRVHPDDVAAVEIAGLAGPDGGLADVVGDAQLAAGDVVVDTESGRVDARVETRFVAVAKSVRDALEAA